MLTSRRIIVLAFAFCSTSTNAFMVRQATRRSTSLYLEDWVASLIDDELYREKHIEDFEKEWMNKNRNQILQQISTTVEGDQNDMADFRQLAKDKKLARSDPQRYCADRCIATGNCDVYEDIFELSPSEVLSFCNECVLNENESECKIPDAFYEFGDPGSEVLTP